MLNIVERKHHRALTEGECQDDLLLKPKLDIHIENHILHQISNKLSIALKTLHNLSHRSILSKDKEPIGVE